MNLLEENTGNKISYISLSNIFYDLCSSGDRSDIKRGLKNKEWDKKMERQPTEWVKIFSNCTYNKVSISKNEKEDIHP